MCSKGVQINNLFIRSFYYYKIKMGNHIVVNFDINWNGNNHIAMIYQSHQDSYHNFTYLNEIFSSNNKQDVADILKKFEEQKIAIENTTGNYLFKGYKESIAVLENMLLRAPQSTKQKEEEEEGTNIESNL